ncbi:MAG: iron-containing alcohol dehydrogenase, partial [Planctomycetes bacterium]|nr:iron-containing alcohol dehydrogenase [Planctomycetota bacterium]
MSASLINYLTAIQFGNGAVTELPALLIQHDIKRPMLVTDRGLVELGLPERLPIDVTVVFSDVPTNPTEESVVAGATCFRDNNCDGVIALGGGSPIDCAKGISILATHPEPLDQYALIRGGLKKISGQKPPVIAIPTTSGTGSEAGRGALISFSSGEKLALISPHVIPTAAICDPDLTVGLPPLLTAATGMDAISHCVETFCSPKVNAVADAIALDGLARAFDSLRAAVANGSDLHPRTEMMMASLQGGLTFQKGLGMIHSLSHPLGALPDKPLHHGTLNAIFLPHVLRFNADACPEKLDRMAEAMKCGEGRNLPAVFERR